HERDGKVWWDDSVEFYCDPARSGRDFFQFDANAAGVVYDASGSDEAWNSTVEVVTARDAAGYTVAMRVPFASMQVRPPEGGDRWRVNFARHGPGSPAASSSWVWSYNGLDSPREFGELVFAGPRIKAVRVASVTPPAMGGNVVALDDASGLTCWVVGRDRDGVGVFKTDARLVGGQFTFTLEDDRVRTVETRLEDTRGNVRGRWWSDLSTAELTPRLADWTHRVEVMTRVAGRFAAPMKADVTGMIAEATAQVKDAGRIAADKRGYSAAAWRRLAEILDDLDRRFGDLSCYARTLEHFSDAAFAVGLESPMRKVLIRDHPFEGWFDRQMSVSLAANEREAAQVVVMPFGRDVKNVRVSAAMAPATRPAAKSLSRNPEIGPAGGRSHTRSGTDSRSDGITCSVSLVGHVDVNDDPPYDSTYKGLWPDPLLSFMQTADVAAGEHVAFWVDVATAKGTPGGDYRGTIRITADGCEPVELALNVRVWGFELADGTHLQNAFTYHEAPIHQFYKDRWNDDLARKYRDLVLDHRLGIDHLYRREPPDREMLKHALSRGMNAFNIVFAGSGGAKPHVADALGTFVPWVRREGLTRLAYVYGFDEIKKDKFADARDVFDDVHRRYRGIRTMTTAQDKSFGKETGLRQAVDIWVPLTPGYDLREAEQLRREGREMWWYICLVPTHPYANWFVEYPAIEARLLMGAMSYKYRVDGFLYYLINNHWERNRDVIRTGPRTGWDPASCPNRRDKWANGDGNLIYPGPDGPLSSIRLANIRDGLEDYEYLYLLAERVKGVESLPPTADRRQFLAAARPLLAVPATVVRSTVEYTT
ncbi:MAG: DUF4091 domain-containing protein, partial [Planctomycetes bacterium]|nr:DUF4091 domain-containing protein [Planctomycetota bacterium]